MALLLDSLFLTKVDLKDFRDISANISEEKINIFIREAQSIEGRGFLGQALWFRMQDDWTGTAFTEQALTDLWFGVDYVNSKGDSIRFNGFGSAVLYFAYSRFLAQQQDNVSRFGVVKLQDDISVSASNAEIRSREKDAYQVAFNYQNDATVYITDQKSQYPEWETAEDLTPRKTSLSFFKL